MGALTFAEFQGHSNRGGKRAFLKDWKKKDPYSIDVWLHPYASIMALWRHRFLKVVRRDQGGKATVEIWSDPLLCWEDEEAVLQKQNFFDKSTGEREVPPQICPHCLMIDWFRNEIRANRLDWCEPVLKYECDDPQKTVILHAGGVSGMFNNKNLPAEKKQELIKIPRERGGPVYQRGDAPNVAFKQESKAKLEYAFAIIDANNVGSGVQIAVEPNLLGERVQGVIAQTKKSLGADRGDIQKYPYAIKFEHDPAEGIPFDKKYNALRMEMIRMTPAVQKLMNDPPPDMEGLGTRFNPMIHMANLERQMLIELPLQQFFGKAIEAWMKMGQAAPAQAPGTRVPEVGGGTPLPAPAEQVDPNEQVMCGWQGCKTVMFARDPKCPGCGKVYIVEADPLPLPPPMRTRASMGDAPMTNAPMQSFGDVDPDDQIPF
jgi:hypothetical protein